MSIANFLLDQLQGINGAPLANAVLTFRPVTQLPAPLVGAVVNTQFVVIAVQLGTIQLARPPPLVAFHPAYTV